MWANVFDVLLEHWNWILWSELLSKHWDHTQSKNVTLRNPAVHVWLYLHNPYPADSKPLPLIQFTETDNRFQHPGFLLRSSLILFWLRYLWVWFCLWRISLKILVVSYINLGRAKSSHHKNCIYNFSFSQYQWIYFVKQGTIMCIYNSYKTACKDWLSNLHVVIMQLLLCVSCHGGAVDIVIYWLLCFFSWKFTYFYSCLIYSLAVVRSVSSVGIK